MRRRVTVVVRVRPSVHLSIIIYDLSVRPLVGNSLLKRPFVLKTVSHTQRVTKVKKNLLDLPETTAFKSYAAKQERKSHLSKLQQSHLTTPNMTIKHHSTPMTRRSRKYAANVRVASALTPFSSSYRHKTRGEHQ